MLPSKSLSQDSAGDDFFNDLTKRGNRSESGERPGLKNTIAHSNSNFNEGAEDSLPRTKRIACIVCRKRKLRCDGTKPRCGTCERLGHTCAYDEVRKKSGPKRGYVKHLEARLAQVETLLKNQDISDPTEPLSSASGVPSVSFPSAQGMALTESPNYMPQLGTNNSLPDLQLGAMEDPLGIAPEEEFSWELISLGLEEPLPGREFIDEMHHLYFERVHPSMPIIHRLRYLAAMDLAPNMRPAVCLRYAMWTHVCSITPRYSALASHFYARARKYAELDEMRGFGECIITIAHCQCWSLLATYEFKMMYFPRAWMSVGRATRLSQLMSLQSQDAPMLDAKQALPPPRDWIETEERRRVFWMTFTQDRYASIGTGWPMTIDERDITTNLPATEDAFLRGIPEGTVPLSAAMTPDGASTLSSFGGVVLMACLFGRNLIHLHRTHSDSHDHDLNGSFWQRHRQLDNILLNTSLSLPHQLRLPAGINDTNIVFVNMNIHAATICLHQAAIFKADKNHMSPQVSGESKRRCMIAADQIASVMKLVSHIDLSTMNPFIAFCLHVAARVFVQYLKIHKDDMTRTSSLQFLLSAMQALKAKNPLTESFLVQLDVDLEASGLRVPSTAPGQSHVPLRVSTGADICRPTNVDQTQAKTLFDLRLAEEREKAMAMNPGAPAAMPMTSSNLMDFSRESRKQRPDLKTSLQPPGPDSMFGQVPSSYEETSGGMDIDLSLDSSSGQRFPSQPNSRHPTPSASSNNASSQYSFSPPHADEQSSLNTNQPSPNTAAAMFPGGKNIPSYPPDIPMSAEPSDAQEMPNTFAMPAAWDHTNTTQNAGDARNFDLIDMNTGDAPSWQPVNIVDGNEWLYSNWNGADTSS